jgi:hypothetical protein
MYGPIVHFHGKGLTREQLLQEKRRAVQRWPEREYKSRPSTVVASCVAATRCTVRSVYDYRVADPETGRTGKGTEQLRLRVSLADGAPVIVQEESGPVSVSTGLPLTRPEAPHHNARGDQTQNAPQANSTAGESSLRMGRAGASSRRDQAKQHTSKSEHSPEKVPWEKRPIVKLKDPDPVSGAKASRAKPRSLQAADRPSTRMSSRGTTRFIQSTIEIAEPEALSPFGPHLIDVPPGSVLEPEEFELP